jgi:hypothetical protein
MTMGTLTFTVDEDADIVVTHLQIRNLKASFFKLVELLGEPSKIEGGDHARYHWAVEFSDGNLLDLYDWNDDRRIEDVTEWNVAARDFMTAGRIYDILAGRPIIA